jgi:hypothetical protein
MTRTALIGYTGFVGGTLLADGVFDGLFNSKNIEEIAGKAYDTIICAGVPAVKWMANAAPEQDRATIDRLRRALDQVHAREFILVSTIDVYPNSDAAVDERAEVDNAGNHAYGANRRELERWVSHRFLHSRIIRLPALFGRGLKKNALFDLLHRRDLLAINPASAFQWYPIRRLHADIEKIRETNLSLVNLFSEPVPMRVVIDAFFPGAETDAATQPPIRYDLRTQYSQLFGGRNGYALERTSVLGEMAEFVAAERMRGETGC